MPTALGLKEGANVSYGRLSGNLDIRTEKGVRTAAGAVKLWALEGRFPVKQIILSKPITVEGKVVSTKKQTAIEKFQMDSAFAKVNAGGTFDELTYNADIDLADLQRDFGHFTDFGKNKIQGRINASGKATIKENQIAAKTKARITDLAITSEKGITAGEKLVEVEADLRTDIEKQAVFLNRLGLNSQTGRLDITRAVVPTDDDSKENLKAEISADIDLAKSRNFAVALAGLDAKTELAGRMRSNIRISEEQKAMRIFTDSTYIDDMVVVYPGQEPLRQEQVSIKFDAVADRNQKTINIKDLQIISDQIKIKKAVIKQTSRSGQIQTDGQMQAEYDWSAVSTMAAGFLPAGFKVQGKRKDKIEFSTVYPEGQGGRALANMNGSAEFGFDRADLLGLVFGAADIKAAVKDGILTIEPISTKVNDGKFNFAANADFKIEPTVLQTPGKLNMFEKVNITAETCRELLKYVNPIFAGVVSADGVFDFECEKMAIPLGQAGTGKLEIIGTMSVSDMRLSESSLLSQIISLSGGSATSKINIEPTRFILKDEVLRYDKMRMNIGERPIDFSGWIGLDKSMSMTATLPIKIGDWADKLDLPLTGTVDNPTIDTKKIIELQLRQQLRRGLEELLK